MRISIFSILLITCTLFGGSLPFAREGVIDTPTAFILDHTELKAGGSITGFTYENADSTGENDFAIAGHIEFGIFNYGQIGACYLGSAAFSGHARVLVLRETMRRPGIAIGVENIIGEENYEFFADTSGALYQYGEKQNFSAYVVFTKDLRHLTGAHLCISLGYGIGRFQQNKDYNADGFDNPVPGLFASLQFHPSERSIIALEWDGRDGNLGFEYVISPNVSIQAALVEFEQVMRSSSVNHNPQDVMQNIKFGVGVEVTFGPFVHTRLQATERLQEEKDEEALRALEELRARANEEIEELEDSMD